MFKKKKIKRTSAQKNRKWKLMIIPRDKDGRKSQRVLRYLEAEDGSKVFVEKLRNYNLYIVSTGTNPGAVHINNVSENLKSALLLANNRLAEIKEKLEKQ
jgi:hypothetical protein